MRASTRQLGGCFSWITMPPSCPLEEGKDVSVRSESLGRMPELGASCYSRAWRDEDRWSPLRNAPCRRSHSTPFAWGILSTVLFIYLLVVRLITLNLALEKRKGIPLPVGQVEKGESRWVWTPLLGLDVRPVVRLITVAGRLRGRHTGCGAVGIWICKDMTANINMLSTKTRWCIFPLPQTILL